MSFTFNQALQAAGLDPHEVRLLRHQTNATGRRTPYTLWRDERALFEAYQATQAIKNRARLDSVYWASFVVTTDGSTLFAALYRLQGREPMRANWPYPLDAPSCADQDELYLLEHVDALADLEGHLHIDWGSGMRSWIQRADQQDKRIVELARKFAEPAFPGYSAFVEPLSRIASLPSTWTAVLSASHGVYLLTCPETNELYVGSASGEGGFISRWLDYATTGHGGNVMLKSREPSDYQVSILEVAGSLETDILAIEARWKRKLRSREMGLNAN